MLATAINETWGSSFMNIPERQWSLIDLLRLTMVYFTSDPTRLSIRDGECTYNGPDGRHCAAALMVKPDSRAYLVEDTPITKLLNVTEVATGLTWHLDFWDLKDLKYAMGLAQDLHDSIPDDGSGAIISTSIRELRGNGVVVPRAYWRGF